MLRVRSSGAYTVIWLFLFISQTATDDKRTTLTVSGRINGVDKPFDEIIRYSAGDNLEYDCVATNSITVKWLLEKDNVILYEGIFTPESADLIKTKKVVLKMKLYAFDNGTQLTCKVVYQNGTGTSESANLRLTKDTDDGYTKTVNLNDGTFNPECDANQTCYYYVKNLNLIKSVISEDDYGMLYVRVENDQNQTGLTKDRKVAEVILLTKGIKLSLVAVIGMALGAVIALLIIVILIFFCRKHNWFTGKRPENEEPLYWEPMSPTYIELQLGQASNFVRPIEETPYSQIIGVMAPADYNTDHNT